MRQEMIFSAIGDISDDLILDAEISSFALPNTIRLFRWKRLVAACLIIVMLAVPVSAEMINGYVSNLLAPLYGCAQTEIVDKIGKPIGASVIVDDYKLTADAIIGDQYSVAIVYSLSRIDGTPLEEGLTFQVYSNSLKTNGGASYSQFLSEDKMVLNIVEKWVGTNELLFNRNVQITFSNLIIEQGNKAEATIVQQGNWDLRFCLRYENTSSQINMNEFTVTDSSAISYQINKIFISPVGIHMDMTVPNPHLNGIDISRQFEDFYISLVLNTGERIDIKNRNLGYNGNLDDEYLDGDYTALFTIPLDISTIREILICEKSVPIADMPTRQ